MITAISRIITNFLVCENIIEEERKDAYLYGIELLISSLFSVTIMLFFGILFGKFPECIMFYFVFCTTRLFCGGYHAKSYAGCKLMFTFILCAVLILDKVLTELSIFHYCILWSIYAVSTYIYAPIENSNKKLNAEEKKKNHIRSIVIAFVWLFVMAVMGLMHNDLSKIILLTLIFIASLMILQKIKEKKVIAKLAMLVRNLERKQRSY